MYEIIKVYGIDNLSLCLVVNKAKYLLDLEYARMQQLMRRLDFCWVSELARYWHGLKPGTLPRPTKNSNYKNFTNVLDWPPGAAPPAWWSWGRPSRRTRCKATQRIFPALWLLRAAADPGGIWLLSRTPGPPAIYSQHVGRPTNFLYFRKESSSYHLLAG